jgi:hypothetical protein
VEDQEIFVKIIETQKRHHEERIQGEPKNWILNVFGNELLSESVKIQPSAGFFTSQTVKKSKFLPLHTEENQSACE